MIEAEPLFPLKAQIGRTLAQTMNEWWSGHKNCKNKEKEAVVCCVERRKHYNVAETEL